MVEITDMNEDDIEEQLRKLDEVHNIISGMKNEDLSESDRKNFMKKADKLIKKNEEEAVKDVIK